MLRRNAKIVPCLFCALFFCLFAIYLNVQYLRQFLPSLNSPKIVDFAKLSAIECNSLRKEKLVESKKKNAWIVGKNIQTGYLEHVFEVFARLGYGNKSDASPDWRILWSHNYPFEDTKLKQAFRNQKSYQLINHVPGSWFYTSKVQLATSGLGGIPLAFKLPESKGSFLQYAESRKEKLWVQKNSEHRGIKVDTVENLNLDKPDTFVQEFIHNPLLIDGKKFDIGIYTVITSIDPLIVYILHDEALLRFCPKNYHPFDAHDVDKYVIGDDYTPVWQMPSLKQYYLALGLNRKESLNAYFRLNSIDPTIIWNALYETIRSVLLNRKQLMAPLLKRYKYPLNFFELSRFDFVIDDQFNVYLMEANMSPNLSSGHFIANKAMYEQVIFNMLSLLGLTNPIHTIDLTESNDVQMAVPDRELSIDAVFCFEKCSTCEYLECRICFSCMKDQQKTILRRAYLEHMNRHSMRRLVPKPIITHRRNDIAPDAEDSEMKNLRHEQDQLLALWFLYKCRQDSVWCS